MLDDGHDAHAFHFVLRYQNTVIAAARLCVHKTISEVPDPHLFTKTHVSISPPFGCVSRLVVHPQYRGLGIAAILDTARTEIAKKLGCKSILIIWNEHSGTSRRKAIYAQGFTSMTNEIGVADGEWGKSYPYVKNIENIVDDNIKVSDSALCLQIFSDELNRLLPLIDVNRFKTLSIE